MISALVSEERIAAEMKMHLGSKGKLHDQCKYCSIFSLKEIPSKEK